MKPKLKKRTKSILSDKIADALTVKPRPDIEDDHIFNTKPNTVTRTDFNTSESEDDAIISDFRKRNVNLLSDISKKYEGQIVSRKDVENSDETSEDLEHENLHSDYLGNQKPSHNNSDSSGNESDDYNILQKSKQLLENSDEDRDDSETNSDNNDASDDENDNNDVGEDDDDDDDEEYDISQMEEPIKEQFEHVKKQNISEEAKKGVCVRNQLLLWEGLLEMRIHLQRCVNTANSMPMPEMYRELKTVNDYDAHCTTTIKNVTTVLDKLMSLQNLLLKNFPETKTLSNNKNTGKVVAPQETGKESNEEIPSDTDNEEIPSDTEPEDESARVHSAPVKKHMENTKKRKLEDFESEIASSFKSFKSFRDTTIQKWNEKTRVATSANLKTAPSNTILQQISYILSDKSKLVRRTQLKRTDYDIIGYKKESLNEHEGETNLTVNDRKYNDEYISEIFDDSDFYHQLLRELIECKSADISDPIQLSRQWIALQQMRSKMKRKVDTKATKGRKIKYVVHNKLMNYMAPIKSSKWNEESTNELYSSLFGKMFEHNNVGLNVNLENVTIKD